MATAQQAATDNDEANDRTSAHQRNVTMREFFKPCRRKLGMVTLGLACVFAAGWVRSLSVDDFIQLPTVQTMAVGTEPGCLLLFREAEAVLISEVPGLEIVNAQ